MLYCISSLSSYLSLRFGFRTGEHATASRSVLGASACAASTGRSVFRRSSSARRLLQRPPCMATTPPAATAEAATVPLRRPCSPPLSRSHPTCLGLPSHQATSPVPCPELLELEGEGPQRRQPLPAGVTAWPQCPALWPHLQGTSPSRGLSLCPGTWQCLASVIAAHLLMEPTLLPMLAWSPP